MIDDVLTVAELAAAADETLSGALTGSQRRLAFDEGFAPQAWQSVVTSGWASVLLDRRHGGLGLGTSALGALFACAGRHLLPGPLLASTVAAPLLINETDVLAAGPTGLDGLLFAWADPEDHGAPADEITISGGTVDGRVELVHHGARADMLLVVGTDGSDLRVALVPVDATGVTIQAMPSLDTAAGYASVDLVGAEAAAIAGDSALVDRIRRTARLMISFQLAGLARHLLDESVAFALQRHQFGRPIGSFQAIKHLLADMCVDVIAAEALCRSAALEVDAGETLPDPTLPAKACAAATARSVGEGALQVHGGIAFTREYDLHRWFLHALSLQDLYGAERTLVTTIGTGLLDIGAGGWQ